MELVGILASLIIFLSFLANNIKLVRKINIVGCILFVIYGINTGAFSVWFLNGGLCLIHIYYLIKIEKEKK